MGYVVTCEELLKLVCEDRSAGKTLALANGCFDLLHVGHLRYLVGAALEADRLIVAVNDDESVTMLKGRGRPIIPSTERAEILAAFRVVDYVVLFSGETVSDLLDAIKPDVHCKGTDYTVESVPEREIVRRYGGRTAIVGDQKNRSTHDLLIQIVNSIGR